MPRATYPGGGGQSRRLSAPAPCWRRAVGSFVFFLGARFVEGHGVLSWCLLPRARFRCYPPQTVSYSETHPLASNADGLFPRALAVVAPCLQHECQHVSHVNENMRQWPVWCQDERVLGAKHKLLGAKGCDLVPPAAPARHLRPVA